ncbi:serpin family protein [bacterium]|nr:serpin family protein [bacterium]
MKNLIKCAVAFQLALGVAAMAETDVAAVTRDNTAFALDMYSLLKKEPGNLFFSPYSISAALAMTQGGARGETAAEMEKALRFAQGEQVHAAFGKLNGELEKAQEGGKIKLCIANSLWPQAGHPFLPEYLALIKKNYGASVTPLDYKADPQAAAETINKWVEQKTQDKIKQLFSGLDRQTAMVLVNAIYFKGNWAEQFEPKRTQEGEFTLADGLKVKAPMMGIKKNFPNAKLDGVQLLEMPYVGDRLSMVVILPNEPAGITQLEDRLDTATLASWIKQMTPREIIVSIPKFKITWGAKQLAEPLKALGMRAAFEGGTADFSGMDGTRNLFISQVVHKAFVEVNEEGTEAAAATGVVMTLTAVREPLMFRADHPFLFLIRDKSTGAILFMGRVMDPTK